MDNVSLQGIFPVMPTPLTSRQEIDFDAIPGCLEYYQQSAIHGITILGSGGELPYFSAQEQVAVAKIAAAANNKRVPLIIGVNAYSEHQAIEQCQAMSEDADYIMLLITSYYQQPFEQLLAALKNIAAASPIPVIYYHFPQVSKQFVSAAQLVQILNIDNIVGIKDSAMHLKTAKQVLAQIPQTAYFSGLSLLLPTLLKYGAAGAICPIAAIAPTQAGHYYQQLQHQARQPSADQVLKSLLPLVNKLSMPAAIQNTALQFVSKAPVNLLKQAASSHAVSKEAMRLLGMPIDANVRMPLPALPQGAEHNIKQILVSAGLLTV